MFTISNFRIKAIWSLTITKTSQKDKNISRTINSLTAWKGIERKSANVITGAAKLPDQGIPAALNVTRLEPRIAIIPEKKR